MVYPGFNPAFSTFLPHPMSAVSSAAPFAAPGWETRALSCDRTLCIWAVILDQPRVDRGVNGLQLAF